MKAGDVIAGKYRLLHSVGGGGMGTVWAAHHEVIDRDVAIKITDEKVSQKPEIRERFLNEARAVGRLRHPNIIDIIDFGEMEERLYIVFELLQGASLAERLDDVGRLSQRDAAIIGIEICRALEVAHAAGVIHRDLKPANIYLHKGATGGTVVKVLDFGISKLYDADGVSLSMTQTGMVMGTPQYMSVEQAKGADDIDLRTDVWGVGVLLYEMIAGVLPFEANNYNAMIVKIMQAEPVPLHELGHIVSPVIEAVIGRCLAKPRTSRFQSARDLRDALAQALVTLPKEGQIEVQSPSTALGSLPPFIARAPIVPLVVADAGAGPPAQVAAQPPGSAPPPFVARSALPRGALVVTAAAFAVAALVFFLLMTRSRGPSTSQRTVAGTSWTAAPSRQAEPLASAVAPPTEVDTAPASSALPAAPAASLAVQKGGPGDGLRPPKDLPRSGKPSSPGGKKPMTKVESAGF